MYGIQVVRLLDVLKVNTIRNAKGVSPRSVVVSGDNFTSVETVLINGYPAPEFVVYSKTELVAQVPSILGLDSFITDVSVLSSKLTFTQQSVVQFTIGTKVRKVDGIIRLMQTFLRLLLRTPGSNIFHPRSGGGAGLRVGTNINKRSAADLTIAVNNTRQYIVSVQTPDRNIPPTERLLSAEVANVSADRANTAVMGTIILTSHAGHRSAATITM